MAWDGVLVRFGEIGIKSPPVRRQMEQRLRQNLEDAMVRRRMEGHVSNLGPRLWMTGPDIEGLVDVATHCFGVVSVSRCILTKPTMADMGKTAAKLALEREWKTFGVRSSRHGEHPFKSRDMGIEIGSAIYTAAEAAGRPVEVDLDNPDLAVHVDARDGKAWVFVDKQAGPGGLPLGSQGKVVALISDQFSALAAWLMMRRGCKVIPVHAGDTGSLPIELVEPLQLWGMPDVELLPVCSGKTSKQVLLDTASHMANRAKAQAVVTGDTLFSKLLTSTMPVLRPTCGLDAEEAAVWCARATLPVVDVESFLDDDASETVESLLSMRRTVSL